MQLIPTLLATAAFALSFTASAQEAAIRKTLAERIPQMEKIDEVRTTAMPGLYEVRIGTDLFYTDAKGNYVIQGELIDTKARRNLTEDRINKLTAVDFSALPLKDAFTIVRGDGKRKVAVFEDPNCGYCKRLGKELEEMDDITVYTFLYPILSEDSKTKSDHIWCAKDKGKAWTDWVVGGKAPAEASCDTGAVARNVELGQSLRISGTPTIFLADGSRIGGYVPRTELEKALSAVKQ